MKKKIKKGFTVVELVIVIAVIAILAAVLIPTFTNIVKKANVSNDTSLVKNINIALAAEEATDGKPATMHEALAMAEENGFVVEKLTPRSSGDIVWDSTTNRFALIEGDKTIYSESGASVPQNASVWKIVSTAEEATASTTYSSYIKGTDVTGEISVTTGLDVGENTGITSITYASTDSQEVVIRTNSMETEIGQSSGTIHHYGQGKYAITSGTEWCEHGTLCEVQVSKGTVNIEDSAKVNGVKATGTEVESITCNNDSLLYVTADSSDNLVSSDKVHVAEGTLIADEERDITSSAIIYNGDDNFYEFSNSNQEMDEPNPLAEYGVYWTSVTLLDDLELEGYCLGDKHFYNASKGFTYLFDLNGHKLSISGENNGYSGIIYLKDDAVSTFKNGTIEFKSVDNSKNQIEVGGGTHTFENVTIDASSCNDVFYFTGDGNLNLKNCKITAASQCITTNANKNDGTVQNPTVTISNCELESKDGFGIFNTNNITFDIDNSTIKGTQGALFLRNGVTHIDNCTLISTEGANKYTTDTEWGTDGNVPAATLVVGNCGTSASSYGENITCIVKNSSITNKSATNGYKYAVKGSSGVSIRFTVDGKEITETKK